MPRGFSKLFHRLILSRPITRIYDRLHAGEPLGKRGERLAERFLLKQGMVIVARGYEDRFGELDLVGVEDRTIVFVEVKTRTSDDLSAPTEAVDEDKQQRITRTAKGYLKWHRLTECPVRFDVIAILWPNSDQAPDIRHFRNAFESTESFQMF